MAQMVLGPYTFAKNPSGTSDMMTPERKAASVETFSTGAFFSWGADIFGKKIDLTWPVLSTTQYDQFQTMLVADAGVVFNPQDGSGKTYNVEITALSGEYWKGLAGSNRRNVTLSLLVLSEVA